MSKDHTPTLQPVWKPAKGQPTIPATIKQARHEAQHTLLAAYRVITGGPSTCHQITGGFLRQLERMTDRDVPGMRLLLAAGVDYRELILEPVRGITGAGSKALRLERQAELDQLLAGFIGVAGMGRQAICIHAEERARADDYIAIWAAVRQALDADTASDKATARVQRLQSQPRELPAEQGGEL